MRRFWQWAPGIRLGGASEDGSFLLPFSGGSLDGKVLIIEEMIGIFIVSVHRAGVSTERWGSPFRQAATESAKKSSVFRPCIARIIDTSGYIFAHNVDNSLTSLIFDAKSR
jgi:hypothetical protein